MPKRDNTIDALRTIALLCIIVAHINAPELLSRARIFDVVCMVVLVGMSYSLSEKDQKYLNYIIQRFKRLVLPTWYFLIFFFCIFMVLGLKNPLINIDATLIKRSFALLDGIGYVWIIRVYILIAIISPGIKWVSKKIKNNFLYLITILLIYGIYLFIFNQFQDIKFELLQFVLNYYVLYALGYGMIAAIGYRYRKLHKKECVVLLSTLLVVLTVCMVKIGFQNIVDYKYPPQTFYIVYGLVITFILYELFQHSDWLKKLSDSKVVVWMSKNALWIYLWHIIPLYFIKYYELGMIEINYLTRFIYTFGMAILLTLLQNILKKSIINYIYIQNGGE